MAVRRIQLLLRLNEEEKERLESLAEHYGLDRIPLIRMLIKHEFDWLQQRKEKTDAEESEEVQEAELQEAQGKEG